MGYNVQLNGYDVISFESLAHICAYISKIIRCDEPYFQP